MAYRITEAERKSFVTVEDISGELKVRPVGSGTSGYQYQSTVHIFDGEGLDLNIDLPLYNLQYNSGLSSIALADMPGHGGNIYSEIANVGWRYNISGEYQDPNNDPDDKYLNGLRVTRENDGINYYLSMQKLSDVKTLTLEVSGIAHFRDSVTFDKTVDILDKATISGLRVENQASVSGLNVDHLAEIGYKITSPSGVITDFDADNITVDNLEAEELVADNIDAKYLTVSEAASFYTEYFDVHSDNGYITLHDGSIEIMNGDMEATHIRARETLSVTDRNFLDENGIATYHLAIVGDPSENREVSISNNTISGLVDPVGPSYAANKSYVDIQDTEIKNDISGYYKTYIDDQDRAISGYVNRVSGYLNTKIDQLKQEILDTILGVPGASAALDTLAEIEEYLNGNQGLSGFIWDNSQRIRDNADDIADIKDSLEAFKNASTGNGAIADGDFTNNAIEGEYYQEKAKVVRTRGTLVSSDQPYGPGMFNWTASDIQSSKVLSISTDKITIEITHTDATIETQDFIPPADDTIHSPGFVNIYKLKTNLIAGQILDTSIQEPGYTGQIAFIYCDTYTLISAIEKVWVKI